MIYSWIAIGMWTKFMYFFRIFRETGYYIQMIKDVFYDLRFFIMIFFATIAGFAQAYFILDLNRDGVTRDTKEVFD